MLLEVTLAALFPYHYIDGWQGQDICIHTASVPILGPPKSLHRRKICGLWLLLGCYSCLPFSCML